MIKWIIMWGSGMPLRNWQKLDTYLPVSLGCKSWWHPWKVWNSGQQKIHKANDLLQVASDGLNVNLLFLKVYEEKRCLNELPALLDIEKCGIHTIHGSLNVEKASEWDVWKVLKGISKFLVDLLARRETFEKIWVWCLSIAIMWL